MCDDKIEGHKCTANPHHKKSGDDDLPESVTGLLAIPSGAVAFDDDYDDDLAAKSHTFVDDPFADTGFTFAQKAAAESATLGKNSMRGAEADALPESGNVMVGIAAVAAVVVVVAVAVVGNARQGQAAASSAQVGGVGDTATAMTVAESAGQWGAQSFESVASGREAQAATFI